MDEALRQINAFNKLDLKIREQVIGDAVGRDVHGVNVLDAVLCRTCFGTHKVWSKMGEVIPVSLPMLRGVLGRMAGSKIGFDGFRDIVADFFAEIDGPAFETWKRERLVIGDSSIDFPLFDWDLDAIEKLKAECFPDGGFR